MSIPTLNTNQCGGDNTMWRLRSVQRVMVRGALGSRLECSLLDQMDGVPG